MQLLLSFAYETSSSLYIWLYVQKLSRYIPVTWSCPCFFSFWFRRIDTPYNNYFQLLSTPLTWALTGPHFSLVSSILYLSEYDRCGHLYEKWFESPQWKQFDYTHLFVLTSTTIWDNYTSPFIGMVQVIRFLVWYLLSSSALSLLVLR